MKNDDSEVMKMGATLLTTIITLTNNNELSIYLSTNTKNSNNGRQAGREREQNSSGMKEWKEEKRLENGFLVS